VTGSLFSANVGSPSGGALYNGGGTLRVSGCTFTSNRCGGPRLDLDLDLDLDQGRRLTPYA
jgi:hypothetical protein